MPRNGYGGKNSTHGGIGTKSPPGKTHKPNLGGMKRHPSEKVLDQTTAEGRKPVGKPSGGYGSM